MNRASVNRFLAVVLAAGLVLTAGCRGKVSPPKVTALAPGRDVETWEERSDVKDLAVGDVLEVPYILWGGDVATFLANGGESTQPDTAFAKHGLKMKLVRGDDFAQQVKNYKEGKTPFLRGTLSMIGQASGQIGGDPRCHPIVFLQLTWSAGDHLVTRAGLNTLSDLKGNLSGFDAKAKAAIDLALGLKDTDKRHDLIHANLDYGQIKKLGDLSAKVDAPRTGRFAADAKEKGVIYSFNVYFGGNRADFPEAEYGQHFQRAVEQASLFGNAMISMRGHANASDLMVGFKDAVLKRGIVTQRGGKYFLKDGSEFAMNDMKAILDLIKKENLGAETIPVVGEGRPMSMQALINLLQNLSERRSEAVRKAVVDYASRHGYRLDPSQIKFVGVGGAEPVVMFPPNDREGGKNRRVEFRIIAVSAEAITTEEFDF